MSPAKSVGFIGGGQMAYAMAMGIMRGGHIEPTNMVVSNRSKENLLRFSKEGIRVTQDNMEVISSCDFIFLAVKPQVFPVVVKEIEAKYTAADFGEKVFVSIMAAITLESLAQVFGQKSRIIRVAPSTPCLVGAGTIILACNGFVSEEQHATVKALLSSCGDCIDCPEKLLNTASGITGCACAYLFVVIEALADGAVMHGMPREMALKLASSTVMGAGKLARDSGTHPEALKDAVASPGGTTIRGLHALEKAGFRAALIDAVDASVVHAEALAKK